MKVGLYILISIVVSGCFGVSIPGKDNYLSKNFLGKQYCTKTPLFIWKLKESDTRHFEYFKYVVDLPIKGNRYLDHHEFLAKEKYGFDQEWLYLKQGSKLTIEKIFYYHKFIFGNSGYYLLAKSDNDEYKGSLIDFGSLLNNSVPQKNSAHKTTINPMYVEEC